MKPVLKTLELIKAQGKWLEIVNLSVPTLNDNMDSIREMCGWIMENLKPDVPVHFNRFHPAYKMKHLPTFCPECKKKIISRRHFDVRYVAIRNGKCKNCGHPIPGIWAQ